MAESDYLDYTCPLCTDIQRDPVTIPCGDTFCLECIKIYWDHSDHLVREHRSHNIVSADDERTEKQKVLVATQTEVQHIIQDRMKELQELKHNVDVLKGNAQRAQTDSDKIFIEMSQAVERWHAEISQLIQANLQASMAQAQGYVERLEQEIMELQKRDAELRLILETEDNIHFLQNFPTLSVAPEPMVPKVLINPEFSFSEITKTVSDMKEHLDDICKKELGNISKRVSDTSVYILIPRSGGRMNAPIRTDLPEPKTRADFFRYSLHRHTAPLRNGRPEFDSRLEDLSQPYHLLSLHFASCPS
ncbi:hypothetical protein Q8A67_004059 [Cirrhinus molitorella]|uniref:TRIM8/14/16/25/29/45/65 coiled-coil region domain-containing protein n=1 Tax=Cirrhinus molitorella TaxID=172907 RepID=A0AA88TWX0_9TELE|nr:hypothetical protein Q8A67_004059 [Cirrhinus molitorella]